MTKNTSTSAATDSDQSKLAVAGLMPAAAPADHRKCIVHGVAAEDNRCHNHKISKLRKPEQNDEQPPAGARTASVMRW